MPKTGHDALSLSRTAVRILIPLNLLLGAGILAMLLASLTAAGWLSRILGFSADASSVHSARLIMVLGLVAVPITHVALSRLLAIVESVRSGDPFTLPNAARLQTIAWSVLALEVSRVLIAGLASLVRTPAGRQAFDVELSLTPWLAVLLLLVLARVFEHGAWLREEVEGTV